MNVKDEYIPHEKYANLFEHKRDKVLLEPVLNIIQTTATNIWSEFATAFNCWLNVPSKQFEEIDNNFCKLYYSDLLFENLRHHSSIRSDTSRLVSRFGMSRTLNAMYQIHYYGIQGLIRINPSKAPNVYLEQIDNICVARYHQQEWNETLTCPSEEEYYQNIIKQTNGHFGSEIKFLQMYSDNQNDFKKLSTILGLYVHILEDYRYFISVDTGGSEFYDPDVKLAGFSLPIIHAINSKTVEGQKIADMLRQRTNNKEVKMYAVSILEKLGSFEYTRKTLMKLKEDALLEMRKFGKNSLLESIFDKFLNIQLTADEEQTISQNSMVDEIEIIRISSYYNQRDNDIQSTNLAKEIILKPFNHLDSAPKRRGLVTLFSVMNNTLLVPENMLSVIKNFFSIAGLPVCLLDDIQDSSILRKALPCSYLIYGLINTVNSIFYTFAMALRILLELNKPQAVIDYYDLLIKMFLGQGIELYWRDNFICPTEDAYMQMVAEKTGGGVYLILKLLTMCSTSNLSIDRIPSAMSQYLQIHDDYENLINQDYYDVKGFCEDLSEGKFGFPIVHAVNTHPEEGKLIMDILRQRTYDVELKKTCLSLIEKCGSFKYTRDKLKTLRNDFLTELKLFGDKEQITDVLKAKFTISQVDDRD